MTNNERLIEVYLVHSNQKELVCTRENTRIKRIKSKIRVFLRKIKKKIISLLRKIKFLVLLY
ncbi:hypothetical protein SD457_23825 [Coprobacillaceae bacterium CR2/5/TPMF4]|nr:hypothetical protein SD457_23825 [Coprobacillaceae bacterium CR2/5/TPMF4]